MAEGTEGMLSFSHCHRLTVARLGTDVPTPTTPGTSSSVPKDTTGASTQLTQPSSPEPDTKAQSSSMPDDAHKPSDPTDSITKSLDMSASTNTSPNDNDLEDAILQRLLDNSKPDGAGLEADELIPAMFNDLFGKDYEATLAALQPDKHKTEDSGEGF
ncbi:uncharacterized protein EHS24_001764 [Apiotrichum porosum]|uniref:Uncharacterized protein n=1 Tax=Apiotrichum porosum TaxID=105984 RepID=A0A427XJ81_9TREE|nr:uncharacterized protein EHS24_001764 [Apiotrichum porosum]RSH78843.1 hypothetical protein EHS24_001764 [Apiotrichum porosum]